MKSEETKLTDVPIRMAKGVRVASAALKTMVAFAEDEGLRFPLDYEPSRHERKLIKYFNKRGLDDGEVAIAPVPSVFICFTNRSGSNLLAELLASTGKLPLAHESFNWPQALKLCKRGEAKSLRHFCQLLIDKRAADGTFASKIGWSQLYLLTKTKVVPEVFANPRFLFVRRRDLLGQAISFVIAKQTGQWKSTRPSKNAKMDTGAQPIYDADAIRDHVEKIASDNARFENFFANFDFPHLEIIYEELIRDEAGTVNTVTNWLGLGPSTINQDTTRLKAQRSSINDEWRARFLAERMAYFASSTTLEDEDTETNKGKPRNLRNKSSSRRAQHRSESTS